MADSIVGSSFAPRSFTSATNLALASAGSWFIATRMVSSLVDSSRSVGAAAAADAASVIPVKVAVAVRKKSVTCPVRRVIWSVPIVGRGPGTTHCGVLQVSATAVRLPWYAAPAVLRTHAATPFIPGTLASWVTQPTGQGSVAIAQGAQHHCYGEMLSAQLELLNQRTLHRPFLCLRLQYAITYNSVFSQVFFSCKSSHRDTRLWNS